MNHFRHFGLVAAALCLLGGDPQNAETPPRTNDDPSAVAALKPLTLSWRLNQAGQASEVAFSSSDGIRDGDLQHLPGLPQLRSLYLGDSITDAGLEYVAQVPSLRSLSLGRRITDGGLRRLKPLTGLMYLYCDCPRVTDAGLEQLKDLRNLHVLSLRRTAITDAGLAHLQNMPNLGILRLRDTRVTDAGLESLRGLTKLRTLEVGSTSVTPEGLKKLQQVLHRLQTGRAAAGTGQAVGSRQLAARQERTRADDDPAAFLALKAKAASIQFDDAGCVVDISFAGTIADSDLKHLPSLAGPDRLFFPSGTAVTDSGLEHIGKVKSLTTICLDGLPITSDGLKHLKPLGHLFYLSLGHTKVDDRGLEHLAGMENLYHLSVAGTAVTDAGLRHLGRLPNLHALNLDHTAVSDAGLQTLRDISTLSQVSLVGTRVTSESVGRLEKERPRLKVKLIEPASPYEEMLQ